MIKIIAIELHQHTEFGNFAWAWYVIEGTDHKGYIEMNIKDALFLISNLPPSEYRKEGDFGIELENTHKVTRYITNLEL